MRPGPKGSPATVLGEWQCTICRHPRRTDIEAALLAGRSTYSIGAEFQVSRSAVQRHKAEGHLSRTLKKATNSAIIPDAKRDEILALVQTDEMVKWLKSLLAKSVRILNTAEESGDLKTALAGIHEARANIVALQQVATGMAQVGTLNQQVNVGLSPDEYQKTVSRIIRALEPFPDARIAVLAALEGMKVIECPNE